MKGIIKVCTIALLFAASSNAFAAVTMLDVIGIGTTFGEARADARAQATAICTGMGGIVGNFEVVDSYNPGSVVHVHALAACHH